jgi:SAM-dependent methyltransferase
MTRGHEWSNRVGTVWPEQWQRTDRTFATLAPYLDAAIDRVAPPAGGRVADIGCGAGTTSLSLARRRPDLDILGIDIAPQLIAVAEARGADLPNLKFAVGDAAKLSSNSTYDLLISRHGVMFFDDPLLAFTRLHALAKPGAPIVFSCVRAMIHNRWAYDLVEAVTGRPPEPPTHYVPGPFAFADQDFTAKLLAESGWTQAQARIVDYGYHAGDGEDPVEDALRTFTLIGPAASPLARATPEERPVLIERLRTVLERYRDGRKVVLPASAWIWTAWA